MPPKSSALLQSFLLIRVAYIYDLAITRRRCDTSLAKWLGYGIDDGRLSSAALAVDKHT